jgi:hypothetical protein
MALRGEVLENFDAIKTMVNDTLWYFRRHNIEAHSSSVSLFLSTFSIPVDTYFASRIVRVTIVLSNLGRILITS